MDGKLFVPTDYDENEQDEPSAPRDISYYLMDYYNWRRPHQHNDGLPPAEAENRLNRVSGFS